jgi:hypothetical protein
MVFSWNTGALLFYQRVGFRLDGDYHIVDADALLGVPSKDGSATLAQCRISRPPRRSFTVHIEHSCAARTTSACRFVNAASLRFPTL